MKQENFYSMQTQPVSFQYIKTQNRPLITQLQSTVSLAYNEAKQFISSFDRSISRCRKYNEDKSHKKYQIYIRDLEKANKQLKATIIILQQTISPTKQYMMDLLDQVVSAKQEREKLNRQIALLKEEITSKQIELEQYKMDINKFQKIIKSNKVDKLPPISENIANLQDALRVYLKQKEKIRNKVFLPPSLLQEFIMNNRKKLWDWNIPIFLQELEKYLQKVQKPKQTQDLWRAQFRASKQFNNLIKSTKHNRTASTKHSLMSVHKSLRKKELLNNSSFQI